MQSRRPSPALVVSIIALIAALSGSAVAARFVITSSSQVKNGSLRGADLHNRSISKKKLTRGTIRALSVAPTSGSSTGTGETKAIEAHRLNGPDLPDGGSAKVAELALSSGTYAVFAKTTITPYLDRGLLTTLGADNKTFAADCTLDVNGTGDFAIAPVHTPGSSFPTTLNTQLTRTLDTPATATLTCKVPDIHWSAANTSIIAMKVGGSTRSETR